MFSGFWHIAHRRLDRQTDPSSALCYGAPQPILVAPGLSPPFSFAMSSHINRIAQSAVLGPDSPPYCFVADQGIPFYLGASPAEGHQGSIQFRAIPSSAAVALVCRVPRVGAFILLGSVPMMGLLDCLDRHVSFIGSCSVPLHTAVCVPPARQGSTCISLGLCLLGFAVSYFGGVRIFLMANRVEYLFVLIFHPCIFFGNISLHIFFLPIFEMGCYILLIHCFKLFAPYSIDTFAYQIYV